MEGRSMGSCLYYYDDRTALVLASVTLILLIAFGIFYVSDYIKETSNILNHKLDIILKKIDMFANIIHIVTDGAQEIIDTEFLKRNHQAKAADDLDVQEIRAVDEAPTQEESSSSDLSAPTELVETEELK